MKQINEFSLTKLSNDLDFGFHNRVCALAQAELTQEADAAMLASYVNPYKAYDNVMKLSDTNSYTEAVAKADEKGDFWWRAARAFVRAQQNSPDPDIAETSKKIYVLFDKYGDFTNYGYTRQYGLYQNLLQDIAAIPAEEMNICGFTIWYEAMQDACDRFIDIRDSQVSENATRQAGAVKEARTATDNAYRNLVKYINVMVMVKGETDYASFIDKLNVIVAEMAALIASSATKAANAKEEGDKPVQPEEPAPAE